MDELGKVSIYHIIGGFVAGVICFAFETKGILPVTNEVLGIIVALLILYGLGQYSEKKHGKEVKKFTTWLSNGVIPFYFMWLMVWIILKNYIVIAV